MIKPETTPVTTQMHPDYAVSVKPIETVRDCVEGSTQVKRMKTKYLPHPSHIDQTSKPALQRYVSYLMRANFDGFTATTLRGWLGKIRTGATNVKIPDQLEYLRNNVDGDGTPMLGALESSIGNVFQVKWHICVADYKGLSDAQIKELSVAELSGLNLRANIKQYSRESLVDWDFRRVNGAMQLAYMKLREYAYDFNPATNVREIVEIDLELALDEEGYYYQRKIVAGVEGERSYVSVAGQRLKWLPVEIIGDEEMPVGALPRGLGMLYPIAELELCSYRVSADYQEVLHMLTPTLKTWGWKSGGMEIYKEANDGNGAIVMGSTTSVNLPDGVDMDIISPDSKLEHYLNEFKHNAQKIRALGGIVKSDKEGQRTATEADIDATEQNAMLETVATQQENSWRRLIAYCAMFEGLTDPANVERYMEDNIVFTIPRDFATPQLTVEQVKEVREMYIAGFYTRRQVVELLQKGGWGVTNEIEDWMDELEAEVPPPSSFVTNQPATPTETE